jgi:hypothetical protein
MRIGGAGVLDRPPGQHRAGHGDVDRGRHLDDSHPGGPARHAHEEPKLRCAAVVPDDVVAAIARHWDAGWNGRDVDVIMAPFAEDIVFSSPGVPKITGDPDRGTIVGKPALHDYCVAALRRAGDIRYTLHQALAGTATVVLVYTCHLPDGSDRPGADLLRVDEAGRVVEWACHYATDPTGWR